MGMPMTINGRYYTLIITVHDASRGPFTLSSNSVYGRFFDGLLKSVEDALSKFTQIRMSHEWREQ